MSFWGEFIFPKCVSIYEFPHLIGGYLPFILPGARGPRRIGPHNYYILSIIFGALLGDGYAEKHGNGTRIRFYQEGSHKDYLLWLHSLIVSHGYASDITPVLSTRLGNSGKIRYVIRFNTYTFSSFNWIHECWYGANNIKVVPSCIDQFLSPLALAIWLMDDAGKVSSGLKFCTHSFLLSDVQKLSFLLNQKYDLSTRVHSAGFLNQYVIYVPKGAIIRLNRIVEPYLHPSMKYKLV
jgi:ubiquinol-cytochrome c reductase cytochrome b subunit